LAKGLTRELFQIYREGKFNGTISCANDITAIIYSIGNISRSYSMLTEMQEFHGEL